MKRTVLKFSSILAVLAVAVLYTGCVVVEGARIVNNPLSQKKGIPAAVSDAPMYYGTGSGSTVSGALKSAKLQAVKGAVLDILGEAAAAANKDKLETEVYGGVPVNALVHNDTVKILHRTHTDSSYVLVVQVRINLPAVAEVLRSRKIYGGLILPQGGTVVLADQEPPAVEKDSGTAQTAGAAESGSAQLPKNVTPKEAKLITGIISNLTYMVYYDEKTVSNPFIAKTAVGMANRYLAENGFEYVDLDQIEQIKKDQAAAYEEETGRSVSMIQWIAGKLNADIYIEVSVDTSAKAKGGKYYGSASVSLKNFDASTGAGRGTAFYQTVPPAMSTVSTEDAVNNAVASATYNAIRKAVQQAKVYTEKDLVQGIKYSLVLQNTSDSKVMRAFMKGVERKVKSLRRISTSPAETKYEVRLVGRIEDLEDIVYDVAGNIPGLEGVSLVYQRGNSITFDTGL